VLELLMPTKFQDNARVTNRLLASLPPQEVAKLAPHLREVLLFPGDMLHRPGEPIEHVYFIHSGSVSLMVVLEGGMTVETASIGGEGAVGSIEGYDALYAFTTAVVQVAGSASQIGGIAFRRVVEESPILKSHLNHYHMAVMAQVEQTSACNALHDLTMRLSRILLLAADRGAEDLQLSQESLAGMLGARRSSVTIAARQLRDAGAIEYRRAVIRILDRAKLEELVCECYGAIRRSLDIGFWHDRLKG
jgi:CRP-like cAMP-binding protein